MAKAHSGAAIWFAIAAAVGCTAPRPAPVAAATSASSTPRPPTKASATASVAPPSSATPTDTVSFVPEAPIPDAKVTARGHGQSPRATTPAECAACSGDWGRHGLVGTEGCLCATPDGGKTCQTPLDCEAACIIDDPDARKYSLLRCGPSGCTDGVPFPHAVCAGRYVDFGCYARLVQLDSPTRGTFVEAHYSCLD